MIGKIINVGEEKKSIIVIEMNTLIHWMHEVRVYPTAAQRILADAAMHIYDCGEAVPSMGIVNKWLEEMLE